MIIKIQNQCKCMCIHEYTLLSWNYTIIDMYCLSYIVMNNMLVMFQIKQMAAIIEFSWKPFELPFLENCLYIRYGLICIKQITIK